MKTLLQLAMLLGLLLAPQALSAREAAPIDPNNELFNLVSLYRANDIRGVEQRLQRMLKSPKYWLYDAKGLNIELGYYSTRRYIFLANKSATAPSIALYLYDKGSLREVKNTKAIIGSKSGIKVNEGDLATPIGVYSVNGTLRGLPPYYGPLALPTNYPNTLDRIHNYTGHGIWIHGKPLDGKREANTKGCIAIDNDVIKGFNKTIGSERATGRAVLITYEGVNKPLLSHEAFATLMSSLYTWKFAWVDGDIKTFGGFYDASFEKLDGTKIKRFLSHKGRLFSSKQKRLIAISNIEIIPYPNTKDKKMYYISFSFAYEAKLSNRTIYTSNSTKELYVVLEAGAMKIVAES